MDILHVIDAQYPLHGYGGTERVAYWLAKAQAELGHRVRFLCRAGSALPFAETLELPSGFSDLSPYIPEGVEMVQLYGTPRFRLDYPFLVNIGGNGKPGEDYAPNTVFVSRNHAERHGWTEFVWNGVDLGDYPLRRKRGGDYALFLAKASWRVKNLAGAIAICQEAGLPLHVAGGRAACWRRGVRSFGEVDGQKKLELLAGARALLFPVIWDEPFGLAVVEALASGVPVVATPRGALPEILSAECGVVADSHEGLCQGLARAAGFEPEACRARVEAKFTHIHMAQGYEEYYKRILTKGTIREGFAKAPPNADPERRILYQGYRK